MLGSEQHANLIVSFIFILIIASLTAYYASTKGRNPYIWFALGALLGIFAPLILFFLSVLAPSQEKGGGEPTMTVSQPDPSLQVTEKKPQAPLTPEELKRKEEEDKLWYYLDQNHHQMGPVSVFALRELWNSGRLELTSYVWSEGMADWTKVDNLPDLKDVLNKGSF